MENERLRNEVTRLKAGVVYTAATSGPGGQARASPRARAPSPRRVASPRAQAPMDQEQAVREAQLRQLHNKQRAQLKAFLQLSAGNSKTVGTDDLKLAAKLAKMSLPDEYLQSSQHASKFVASKGEDGAPRDIQWQEFVRALEPENVYKTKADAAKKAVRRLTPPHCFPSPLALGRTHRRGRRPHGRRGGGRSPRSDRRPPRRKRGRRRPCCRAGAGLRST